MKKVLVILTIFMSVGLCAKAQTASGTCKLPGTYDYINVDYYEDGHLAVSNQSENIVTQLHIRVTCKVTWNEPYSSPYGGTAYTKQSKDFTLCDQNYYDISPNRTTRIDEGVKSAPKKEGAKYEYNVEVGNLICK